MIRDPGYLLSYTPPRPQPPHDGESGHVRILELASLRPSPENDLLYKPVCPSDPEILHLATSIRRHGVREPLVVTRDKYIGSGHRRHLAAGLAGLTQVPCRVLPLERGEGGTDYVRLLREHNRQRVKSTDELIREELVSINPTEAHTKLVQHRRERAELLTTLDEIEMGDEKTRARISHAKMPMLRMILRVLQERRSFWPLTDRQIHTRC